MTGSVMRLVKDKGFGFIKGQDGREYFFHRSEVLGTEFSQVREGDEVTFEATNGQKGPRAEAVRLTD